VGHFGLGGEEFDGAKGALGLGFRHVQAVTSVVLHGGADVPVGYAMGCPSAAVAGDLVSDGEGAGGRKGGGIEIELAEDLGVAREFWVDSRGPKQVESDDGLGDEATPQMERKVFVGAAEAGDEVFFERSDGPFGGVGAMDVWRNELKIDVFFEEVFLEEGRCLIVEKMDLERRPASVSCWCSLTMAFLMLVSCRFLMGSARMALLL
jgi:hypothetical protein